MTGGRADTARHRRLSRAASRLAMPRACGRDGDRHRERVHGIRTRFTRRPPSLLRRSAWQVAAAGRADPCGARNRAGSLPPATAALGRRCARTTDRGDGRHQPALAGFRVGAAGPVPDGRAGRRRCPIPACFHDRRPVFGSLQSCPRLARRPRLLRGRNHPHRCRGDARSHPATSRERRAIRAAEAHAAGLASAAPRDAECVRHRAPRGRRSRPAGPRRPHGTRPRRQPRRCQPRSAWRRAAGARIAAGQARSHRQPS